MSDQQRDEEASRLLWLRLISVVVGTVLAGMLQIDALKLLQGVVPGITRFDWTLPVGLGGRLTVGIILTGLAASAGSAFWHDQLDRLQNVKKQAESAAQAVLQIKEAVYKEE